MASPTPDNRHTGLVKGPPRIKGPVDGRPTLMLTAFDLAALGYQVDEYVLSGTAASYRMQGQRRRNGQWNIHPQGSAPYATRIVVARPTRLSDFNGTVLVEWLNVSAGADTAPEWGYLHREIVRSGYAWVGVSAQKAGIDGGGLMSFPGMEPLKKAQPERYADLNHPGDAFCYDIFTQVAHALRNEPERLLGSREINSLIAVGESQSAGRLTTYINAVAPLEQAFNGYLVHSRFGGAPGLGKTSVLSALLGALQPVHLRTDTPVPILNLITETDLMMKRFGYLPARQPDHDRLRTWEVAGTAHADTYVMGASLIDSGTLSPEDMADAMAPTRNLLGLTLPGDINAAPQHHYIMMAALSALNQWVTTGESPPAGERLTLEAGQSPRLKLDRVGNALGGVRSPWMDVPTCRLSGMAIAKSRMGALFGSTAPLDPASLSRLYPAGRADYLVKFSEALAAAISAGFILSRDRTEIEALAAASYPG
nr:alpha/beta hydrolase domain-containing protein [Brevundimonas subvibrioides]